MKALNIGNRQWITMSHVTCSCSDLHLLLQKRPPDNAFYVRTCNENPKKTRWWYHGK